MLKYCEVEKFIFEAQMIKVSFLLFFVHSLFVFGLIVTVWLDEVKTVFFYIEN